MINYFARALKRKEKLITHSGSFHADDVFATACLKIYYRQIENRGTRIIRTRDPKVFNQNSGTVVYDVGGIYDPSQNRYDHHHEGGAGKRENGIPYSAFGLIWKHFGPKLTSSAEIHQEIDDKFVVQICAADTASVNFKIEGTDWKAWTFDEVVGLFQPYGTGTVRDFDRTFCKLVKGAEEILTKFIARTEKRFTDAQKIEQIYQSTTDKRLIILDEALSWKKALIAKPEPLIVIFPIKTATGEIQYCVQTVPVSEKSFEIRNPLRKEWRGKNDQELQKVSGLQTAVFVHNSGYMGITKTLEDAKLMAEKSL